MVLFQLLFHSLRFTLSFFLASLLFPPATEARLVDPACGSNTDAVRRAISDAWFMVNLAVDALQKYPDTSARDSATLAWFMFAGAQHNDVVLENYIKLQTLFSSSLKGVAIRCGSDHIRDAHLDDDEMRYWIRQAQRSGQDVQPYFDLGFISVKNDGTRGFIYEDAGLQTHATAWYLLNPPEDINEAPFYLGNFRRCDVPRTPGGALPVARTLSPEIMLCPNILAAPPTVTDIPAANVQYKFPSLRDGTATMSKTLLHEITHLRPDVGGLGCMFATTKQGLRVADKLTDRDTNPAPQVHDQTMPSVYTQGQSITAYGMVNAIWLSWYDMTSTTPSFSIINPDNYAFYGLALAFASEYKFRFGWPQALGVAVPNGQTFAQVAANVNIPLNDQKAGWQALSTAVQSGLQQLSQTVGGVPDRLAKLITKLTNAQLAATQAALGNYPAP